MSEGLRRWKPQPSTVISLIALFVALGGTALAANLAKNSVKSKHIKDGQVKSGDLADGGVATIDLADGSVSTPKIADNAVTGAKILDATVATADLADNSVNSAKVAADSLVAADLANDSVGNGELANNAADSAEIASSAVGTSEIATDGVGSSEVNNFNLQAVDVGSDTGNSVLNFGSIAANTCSTLNVNTVNDLSAADNVVAVTPAAGFATAVHTVSGEIQDADTIGIRVCNISGAAADPDGGGTTYNWVMFES